MSDFDLCQALESSLDSEETGCESHCFNMTEEVFRLAEGLDLVVSRDPVTLEAVTTVLLAVSRLKRPLTRCGRALSNGELCSAIMDGLVTETVVTATQTSSSSVRTFQRFNSDEVGTLCDVSQKDVVLAPGALKLKAVTLKGGSCERRVTFKLARYLNSGVSRGDGLAVVLSVTSSRHISCCMQDGRALLQLEECSKQKLQNISAHQDMDRFLFSKRTVGYSLNTFESLKHPGWFISTSDQDQDESMEMCRVDAARRHVSFKVN